MENAENNSWYNICYTFYSSSKSEGKDILDFFENISPQMGIKKPHSLMLNDNSKNFFVECGVLEAQSNENL